MSIVLVPVTSRVTHSFLSLFLKVDLSFASELVATGSKRHSDNDEDIDREVNTVHNGNGVDSKKVKVKKPKKPKVTEAEAASKIDLDDLGAFLTDITIPLSHVSENVYKTSVDWISQQSSDALGSFILWSLDSILADLAIHQGSTKGSKKVAQPTPSKSQVLMHGHVKINLETSLMDIPWIMLENRGNCTLYSVLQITRSHGIDVMPKYQLNQVLSAKLGPKWSSNLTCFDYEPTTATSIDQVQSW